jgi:hypothetical protein
MKIGTGLWLVLLSTTSVPARAQAATDVIADCGASSGKTYFLAPGAPAWYDEAGQGRLVFTLNARGKPDLLSRDGNGASRSAAAEGAAIVLTRVDAEAREFGLTLVYPKTGLVETYNVVKLGNGARTLLSTVNMARIGANRAVVKGGVYTAICR